MSDKIPTIFFEIIDQKDSGFYKDDGSKGTPNETQLRTPQVIWIPREGFMGEISELNGIPTPVFKEIRYIKNATVIEKDAQDKMGIKPNPKADVIEFRNGNKLVSRQGSSVVEYDYLMNVFYNKDAPNRPESATALFRAVDLNKNAEILAEDDESLYRTLGILQSLKTKTGVKEQPFKYNEERIDGLCTILGVTADSYATKWYTLSEFGKAQPKMFLKKVENFEQQILTEVSHAIQMNVVIFDGNTAYIKNGAESKMIKEFGAGKMSQDIKMNKLSDFLKTEEGNSALTEMRMLTEVAKNQVL